MARLTKARRHRQQLLLREISWHAKRFAKKAGLQWKTWVWPNGKPFKIGKTWARKFVEQKQLRLLKPRGHSNCSSAKEKAGLAKYHARLRAVTRAEPPYSPHADQMDEVWENLDPVWGRFKRKRRLNVDQTALYLYKPCSAGK